MLVQTRDPLPEGNPLPVQDPGDFSSQHIRIRSIAFVVMNPRGGAFIGRRVGRLIRHGSRVRPVFIAAAAVIPGFHQHHLNAKGLHLQRQAFGIPLDRVLAGRVGALERNAQQPVDGREEHNLSFPCRPHHGKHFPVHPHHAQIVGVHDPVKFLNACFLAGTQYQHPGALYQRVRRRDFLRPAAEIPYAVFVRHVQRKTGHSVLLPAGKTTGPGNHLPSVVPQGHGRVQPKPAGSPRHPYRFLRILHAKLLSKRLPKLSSGALSKALYYLLIAS